MEITFEMLVNGQPHEMVAKPEHQLVSCKVVALLATKHLGPFSRWEVRNQEGQRLDERDTLASLGIREGDRLFVSLQTGIGA